MTKVLHCYILLLPRHEKDLMAWSQSNFICFLFRINLTYADTAKGLTQPTNNITLGKKP